MSRVENQQTQPTYDAESGNRTPATLVGGSLAFFNVDCHLLLLTEQFSFLGEERKGTKQKVDQLGETGSKDYDQNR